MTKPSMAAAMAALVILTLQAGAFAQSPGGAASGPSVGGSSAVGSPNAGSAGAGTAGVSGVPPGPASTGGLNNSVNDPSGVGNSAKVATPPPPGTNSAGTANSSGSSRTTGSGRGAVGGTAATDPQDSADVAIEKEDRAIDRKLKSICRGC